MSGNDPLDLRNDPDYRGRVEYHFYDNSCSLRITNVRQSDSAEYRFMFMTNQPEGGVTGSPGVTLSVTGVHGQSCTRVTYDVRNICAPKGSSVDISCTYYSYGGPESKFWFSPDRSHQWKRCTEPEDLSKDPQYAGRVQISEIRSRQSSLRISELRESDSAQYHFKFKTEYVKWGNSFAGTTLTVTALQVKVISVKVHQDYIEAELRCHSSCSPAGGISYTWLKNGQKIPSAENSSHRFRLYPGDFMSCASKGLENYASPSVYAPGLPSVSMSPSAEIVEGSSVTLTCSSDANPAANYTWYKENEDSPLASGQIFTITEFNSNHSGNYNCEAKNKIGRHHSTFTLTVVVTGSSASIANISRITLGLLVMILLLLPLILWRRKKDIMEAEPAEAMELNSDPAYENISAVTAAQREDREEQEDAV
ncbi:carcinoembryonic antigen-related cell adhesion molecule 6-like [Cheilinus undulatus]|uniref:carcinoembryonic antigen-related cell adhesion molecule 6-like n=1 Tax=Cheilinus undulatus TaxID=241271 RepID=UPI001BD1C1DD|nr:carcinoembryonic antigen-related cell adhesion molecule 6-like [Cheilinus undulatus]